MVSYFLLADVFLSMAGFTFFYVKSVGPAKMEKKIGERAYKLCAVLRMISFMFMVLVIVFEAVYIFNPLSTGLPSQFGWNRIISIVIGSIIFALGGLIFLVIIPGNRNNVEKESFAPLKTTKMYSGIYEKIRHPQAIGDALGFIGIAFFLNSPLIVIISLLWIPLFYITSKAEEKDLLIRFGEQYREYMNRTGMFIPRLMKK